MATLHGDRERFPAGLTEVADRVFAWLQPNGLWGESNAGLIKGEGESLLVDTLWDPVLTKAMLEGMEVETAPAPIRRVVNTHADGDHWWGNQLLRDAEMITSQGSRHEMGELQPGALKAFAALGRSLRTAGKSPLPYVGRAKAHAVGGYFVDMLAPFDFDSVEPTPPTRSFAGELSLDVGGRAVELIEVGPAHTAGDLIVHVPDARTVFAADVAFIGVTPVMWGGPVANWISALDRIQALEPEFVVPGHGPVVEPGRLDEVRAYWEFVEAAARERHGRGVPASRAAREIVHSDAFRAEPFAAWDGPERIRINVHVIYKHLEGEAAPIGTAERIRVFADVALIADELGEFRGAGG